MGAQNIDHLVARLVQAAGEAIRHERNNLAYDQHRLRGVTVELEITASGAVEPARVFTERSAKRDRREPQ